MSHILVVDDEIRIRHLLSMMLERRGFKVDQAGDGVEAFEKIEASSYDMVICDIKMPKTDGLGLIRKIKENDIACPIIFITAFATIDSSVEAMRLGAVDYITKPFDEERIILAVERTLNISKLMSENMSLRSQLRSSDEKCDIVFSSGAIERVISLASKVASTNSAVLITGESGTGKELIARYIHANSDRKNKRFVAVNCAAISNQLVESELFGCEKGAYTGADRRRQGKFEFASGGSLFLDEIGDLPLEAQAKLLRALQEKSINRVGGNEDIPVDIRFICATNQNLEDMVAAGSFRKDFFFRINVFPIHMPPLRERIEDVVPLAGFFLKQQGKGFKIDPDAEKVLQRYHWPGNVRELCNVMERAAILSMDTKIIKSGTLSFLDQASQINISSSISLPPDGLDLEKMEQDLARQALDMSGNNQTSAAKLLGLTRAKFRVLLKQAGLDGGSNE